MSPSTSLSSRSSARTKPAPDPSASTTSLLLDAEETRARVRSPLYAGALFNPAGAAARSRAPRRGSGRRSGTAGRSNLRANPGRGAREVGRGPAPEDARGRGPGAPGGSGDERLLAPAPALSAPPLHSPLRLRARERAAHRGGARVDGMAGARRRDRRAHLLQLLPPHRRRSRALGHERGRLLPGEPSGRGLRSLRAPLPGASRELRKALPRPARASSSRSPGAGPSARPPA